MKYIYEFKLFHNIITFQKMNSKSVSISTNVLDETEFQPISWNNIPEPKWIIDTDKLPYNQIFNITGMVNQVNEGQPLVIKLKICNTNLDTIFMIVESQFINFLAPLRLSLRSS